MIAPTIKATLFCLMDPKSNTESLLKKNMPLKMGKTTIIAENIAKKATWKKQAIPSVKINHHLLVQHWKEKKV